MGDRLTWVWRKRGSNSPESLCKFASFAPVRAAVKAPPSSNPCSLDEVIKLLSEEKPLLPKHKDHPLKGNYKGYRECHIRPMGY